MGDAAAGGVGFTHQVFGVSESNDVLALFPLLFVNRFFFVVAMLCVSDFCASTFTRIAVYIFPECL